MIKKISILIVFSAVLVTAGTVPDFKLKDLENRRVSYSELKGRKLTLIDFWATWCKPCLRAIPKLVELHDNFKDQGVNTIGVNVDSPRNTPKIKPYVRSVGINYPVVLDLNSELSQELHVTVLPTLLIVDANDEIVYIHQGYRPGDEKVLHNKIRELLKEPESDDKE